MITYLSFQTALIMKAARSNMSGTGGPNNKVKYSRLAADDDGYIDLQVRTCVLLFGNSTIPTKLAEWFNH